MIHPVLNHLWQSTLFAGVAGLLTLALRKNWAQTRYWVWMAASVKFLIPFSLLVAAGGQVSWWRAAPPMIAQTGFAVAMEQVSQPFAGEIPAITPAEVPSKTTPMRELLMLAWASGLVAIGLRWWIRRRRVRTAMLGASPLSLPIGIEVRSLSAMLEPGVFGVFRPVLLLPQGVTERLTPAQLRAIVAHEMCHVRRRDNLTTAVHMVVEAVFWFHPLIWWLGTRLVEERERSCDEEVLRAGSDAQTYAEGILKVCEFYLASPLECVAGVSGANLKKRIEEIMMQRITNNLGFSKKLLLAGAGLFALAGPFAVGIVSAPAVRAQSAQEQTGNAATKRPEFDVVSIKPISPTGGGAIPIGRSANPGSVALLGVTPKDVIARAYSLRGYQISGQNWIDQERYDIIARVGRPAPYAEQRLMLQSMLADRFQLTAHTETRVLPAYELVVGKNGPRLHEATPDDIGSRVFPNAPGVSAKQISMPRLAELLSIKLDRPVADKTGLSGLFDIELKWTPDTAPPDADLGPSVFTAVQEQLGLRLEARKLPIEVLIIDHISKPSAN